MPIDPTAPLDDTVDIPDVDIPDEVLDDDTEDTVEIELDNTAETDEEPDFFGNLAAILPRKVRDAIGIDLDELIEADFNARTRRQDQYEKALKRTGLDGEPVGGADFDGASRVVHPMIVEASIDFASRAIKELFPVGGSDSGPVKSHIVDPKKAGQDTIEKAERKSRHMNWQLTIQMPGFRRAFEETLVQTGFGGQQFLKLIWDKRRSRPNPILVPVEDIAYPFEAISFEDAERRTHRQRLTEKEFEKRIDDGMYLPLALTGGGAPEITGPADASNAIEGKEDGGEDVDRPRIVYETLIWLPIEEDLETMGEDAPYVVSIEKDSKQVLSIYRFWFPDDEDREELVFITEFPLLPWRGAPIGLTHVAGQIEIAATGSLRALLDSAHLANINGFLELDNSPKGGKNRKVRAGETVKIDGTVGISDIRQKIMPIPTSPPSAALFQLLGFLTEAGRGLIQTSLDKVADQNPNAPVGTTLALIEQGQIVMSAIHARLHASMARFLKGLHQLNRLHLRDEMTLRDLGGLVVKREDYEGPIDIVPVSDPNIFSEAQRIAQIQMIASRAQAMPMIYDARKVEELILERSKVPNAKDLLIKRPEPKRLNAVNENLAASQGVPLVVFPTQNHDAHLQTHLDFMMSFGDFPLIGPQFTGVMLNHLKDHILYRYVTEVVERTEELLGQNIKEYMLENDDEMEQELDKVLMGCSRQTIKAQMPSVKQLTPIIVDAQAKLKAMAPPPPMDPASVQGMRAQADMARTQAATMTAQSRQQADQAKQQTEQARLMIAGQEAQAKRELAAAQIAHDVRMSQADQQRRAQEAALKQRETGVRLQLEAAKQMAEAQKLAGQQQLAARSQQLQAQGMRMDGQMRMRTDNIRYRMNAEDNLTAKQLASFEVQSGQKFGVSTGTGINPGPRG